MQQRGKKKKKKNHPSVMSQSAWICCPGLEGKTPARRWLQQSKATVLEGSCKQRANCCGGFVFPGDEEGLHFLLSIINHARLLRWRLGRRTKTRVYCGALRRKVSVLIRREKSFPRQQPESRPARRPAVPLHQHASNFPSKVRL